MMIVGRPLLSKRGSAFAVTSAMERVRRRTRAGERAHQRIPPWSTPSSEIAINEGSFQEGHVLTPPVAPHDSASFLVPSLQRLAREVYSQGPPTQTRPECGEQQTPTDAPRMTLASLTGLIRSALAWELDSPSRAAEALRAARRLSLPTAHRAEGVGPTRCEADEGGRSERARGTGAAAGAGEGGEGMGRGPAGREAPALGHEEAAHGRVSRAALLEALARYSPSIDSLVVQRVADRVNLPRTLSLAERLRANLRELGAESFLTDGFPRWRMRALSAHREVGGDGQGMLYAEEAAGIVGRLGLSGSGQRRRQRRVDAFVRYPSDVQANEVLPSGRVVTCVEPTVLADGVPMPRELGTSLKNALRSTGDAQEGGSHGARAQVIYLHFVLYRECASLQEAFEAMAAACAEGMVTSAADEVGVTAADFSVNAPMDSSASVAVQTCSLRAVPPAGLVSTKQREWCRGLCRRLARVNESSEGGTGGSYSGQQQPLREGARVRIQLLGWRRFPCSAALGALCSVQYAVMLRGVLHHSGHQEAMALTAASCIPNFFGPERFGAAGCPFRYYDITAAAEVGRFADAVFIASVVTLWEGHGAAQGWIGHSLRALASDEDRPAVWREHYLRVVPGSLRARAAEAKAALLWNVVASSRVRQLLSEGAGKDSTLAAAPDPGDFVHRRVENGAHGTEGGTEGATAADVSPDEGGEGRRPPHRLPRKRPGQVAVVKPELLPTASLTTALEDLRAYSDAAEPAVEPIFTPEQASPFSVMDVVAPVDAHGASEELRALAVALGFYDASSQATVPAAPLSAALSGLPFFRHLFVAATGFPRAARPWVKEFMEPTDPLPGDPAAEVGATGRPPTSAGATSAYRLFTDMDLAAEADARHDYAARSRGRQADVWPIGRRGHAIADRLPPGLLASAALSHAGPAVATRQPMSKCLVMHYTLPADAYNGCFLREFAQAQNCCPMATTHAAQQSAGPLQGGPRPPPVTNARGGVVDGEEGLTKPHSTDEISALLTTARVEGNILSLGRQRAHTE